ncbi:MAG: YhcH/YjgK/YiaL family protein [Sedimentisphaerales bacterium]|jgi:YhcH/YjgK/YiaL family protein
MILDRIENASLYADLNTEFIRAFEILTNPSLNQKQDGKHIVDGNDLFYTIQRYKTKPMSEGKLEAHRKYIDIQFLLSGVEILGYTPLKGLKVTEEYNSEKDIVFFETPKELTKVKLEPGLFCILFPDDAHLPCRQVDKPAEVRKVVIKVRLGQEDNK